MNAVSPLRYPGGKSAMAGLLGNIRRLNGCGGHSIAEPFAGGAGASIKLLFLEETPDIYLNDADQAIHDFWWAITHRPQQFLAMIAKTRVNMAEWYRQRAVYRNPGRVSRLRRGFAAFYLNRCNRSGIIMNGGPIGGVRQSGQWKIDARFNKDELRQRCGKLAEYRDRVHVSGIDGIAFLEDLDLRSTFLFIDPPYFHNSRSLYLNALTEAYHGRLAERLKSMSQNAWVLSYDDCPEVRRLYKGWACVRPFTLRYTAARRRTGNEVLVTPKWMRLPDAQTSASVMW